ncbi:MAG: GDP-fucose synthetase [Leptothrix sp. (in: Bacteria)]|nr:GDP-fucose synthetase [Leptothrix sp. (in: b-proteobacteria)]
MSKEKVLLTGGNGMVGRNLLEHPALEGIEFVSPGSRELDLRDARAVGDYLTQHRPSMILHAAGRVGGIQANMREPVAFLLDNLDMGRNVVWAGYQAGVRRMINLGSSCMYPRDRSDPLPEELILKGELEPTNEGYALAKIVTARLGDYLMRQDAGFQCKTLVPCNLYGRHDKFDPAHSHLVPAVIHKLHVAVQQGNDTVEIWGDGSARREFMYAGDLADALVAAIRRFDSLPDYMNVGLGHDHSIDDYYRAAADVVGFKGKFVHDTSKPVGMARKLVHVGRQTAWGWSAQHSLRDGLALTYQFYLDQLQ